MKIRRQDLNLRETLSSGQTFRYLETEPGTFEVWDGANFFRLTDGDPILAEGDEVALRRFFGLDRTHVHAELIRRDPSLIPLVEALGSGFRRLYPSDFYEVVFSFLCTANNHLGRIHSMIGKLASRGDGGRFPSLEVLKTLSSEELERDGFGYRAPRVSQVARTLIDYGVDWPDWLRQRSKESCLKQLCTLDGVGPKVADCIAMYGLHRDDVAPMDTHLWQAVRKHYYPDWHDPKPSREQLLEAERLLMETFGDLTADAHLVLYRFNQKTAENAKKKKNG